MVSHVRDTDTVYTFVRSTKQDTLKLIQLCKRSKFYLQYLSYPFKHYCELHLESLEPLCKCYNSIGQYRPATLHLTKIKRFMFNQNLQQ